MSVKKALAELSEIFSESTLHGIPRLLKSKSFLSKIMWALCFLVSIGFCINIIAMSIVDYLQFDTVVDIAYNSEMPTALPVITICNLNQFQTKSSLQFANKQEFSEIENFFKRYALFDSMIELNETLRQSFSYNLNETLISCYFNNLKCTSADFKTVFVPWNGKCFSFSYDSEHVKLSNRIGKPNGFSIELFSGDPKSIPNFIFSPGFKVFISEKIVYFYYVYLKIIPDYFINK